MGYGIEGLICLIWLWWFVWFGGLWCWFASGLGLLFWLSVGWLFCCFVAVLIVLGLGFGLVTVVWFIGCVLVFLSLSHVLRGVGFWVVGDLC